MSLMQYTDFFSCKKKLKISPENFDIFNMFAHKIDRGYTLEPPPRFWIKNKKNRYTPVNPSFYYINVGFKGYTLQGHVFMMLALTWKHGCVNHLRAFRFNLIMFRNSISLTNGFFVCFVIAIKCLKYVLKASLGTIEIFHRVRESMQ